MGLGALRPPRGIAVLLRAGPDRLHQPPPRRSARLLLPISWKPHHFGGHFSRLLTPPTTCLALTPRACVASPKHTLIVNKCPSFQVSALAGCQRCWVSRAQGEMCLEGTHGCCSTLEQHWEGQSSTPAAHSAQPSSPSVLVALRVLPCPMSCGCRAGPRCPSCPAPRRTGDAGPAHPAAPRVPTGLSVSPRCRWARASKLGGLEFTVHHLQEKLLQTGHLLAPLRLPAKKKPAGCQHRGRFPPRHGSQDAWAPRTEVGQEGALGGGGGDGAILGEPISVRQMGWEVPGGDSRAES